MEQVVVTKEQFSQGGPFEISDILKLSSMQDVLEILGKEEIQMYFHEYVTLHPLQKPISAKEILPDVFAIVGGPEPTYTSLYRQARDRPTDEPWAEALFAYRLKRYLEKRECTAVNWRSVYHADTAGGSSDRTTALRPREGTSHRTIALERYGVTLIILERLQRERHLKISSESSFESDAERDEEMTLEWLDDFTATWGSINSFSKAT
ncbi:hypothetical protein F5B19DRAFT_491341 [Rostrohypoxylon terebratum]|nr:hypothetical protein F5B19DRAFT_491341 [Rostrohypoxylon terebratum]